MCKYKRALEAFIRMQFDLSGCKEGFAKDILRGFLHENESVITEALQLASKQEPTLDTPTWLPIDEWNAFVKHRGKKFTTRAKEMTIKKLHTWHMEGQDVAEILNNSVMNDYKGVFPLKGVKIDAKSKQRQDMYNWAME